MHFSTLSDRDDCSATAAAYLDAGLAALPAHPSEKRPLCTWEEYQSEPPPLFDHYPRICVLCGDASGSLECIDFDDGGSQYNAWRELVPNDLLDTLFIESTPSGGYHVVYRCQEPVAGNRRLKPGYEKLHVRFYVKFDRDCAPIHHFFHVGGYNPATPWPQGGAGQRPRGDERFSTGVEPHGDAWVWDYYAYWMEMRGSPPRGQTWGNSFIRDPKLRVERGKWICMELMMKMNDVDDSNGEMALWIEGKKVSELGKGVPKGKWIFDKFLPGEGGEGVRWSDTKKGPEYLDFPRGGAPFEGFRWRRGGQLKLNFLWVLLYITKAPQDHVSKVWFDNIVVAKEYIGPIHHEDTQN